MTFKIKQHDTKVALKAILQNDSGTVDLIGATVRFLMTDYTQKAVIIDSTAQIQGAAAGEVWYVFSYGETDQSGIYKAEFEATFSDGRVETFPTEGYILVEIIRDLG